AILCLITLPAVTAFAVFGAIMLSDKSQLLLLLPGIISLPIFALIANLGGKGIPLSLPTEEAKAAGRSLLMIGIIPISLGLSGLASWAWSAGFFWPLVAAELAIVIGLQFALSNSMAKTGWTPEAS